MERDGEAVGEVAQAGLEMRFRKRDEAAARGFALELLGLDPPSGRPGDNGAGARKAQGQALKHPNASKEIASPPLSPQGPRLCLLQGKPAVPLPPEPCSLIGREVGSIEFLIRPDAPAQL